MFEEYVPSFVVLLMTVMLVTLVVLITRLESLDRRYYASDVVGIMGMTSLATACLVGLFVLFLMYGPVGRAPHHPVYDTVPASNQMSTNEGGTIGVAPSQTDTDNAPPAYDASAERQKSCPSTTSNIGW